MSSEVVSTPPKQTPPPAENGDAEVLTPTPPPQPRRKNSVGVPLPRSTPHAVRLRPPKKREEEEIASLVKNEENTQRNNWELIEDNEWTQIHLDMWNHRVSHDPNIEWAEEGAREVHLRAEDRDHLLMVRACIAHAQLADQRYRQRILDASVRLEKGFMACLDQMIVDEASALKEIKRWEKTHRPWMMASITSPVKKKKNPTDFDAAPPSGSYSFKGRQAWLQEKEAKYARRKKDNRFLVIEGAEDAARGDIDGQEALAFMTMQRDQLSEKWLSAKRTERRAEDEANGVEGDDLSEASVWRRRTDAAKKIQRLGRVYISNVEVSRRRQAAANDLRAAEIREEASRVIQRCGRSFNAKVSTSKRKDEIAKMLEARKEHFNAKEVTELEEETAGTTGAAQEKEKNADGTMQNAVSNESVTTPLAVPQNTSVMPWEASGAQTRDKDNLLVLAKTLQATGTAAERSNLATLFKSMSFGSFVPTLPGLPVEELEPEGGAATTGDAAIVTEDAAADTNTEAAAAPAASFHMLELAFSSFDEQNPQKKAGLVLLAEALYDGEESALSKDGTYPSLERLVLEADWNKTLRDRDTRHQMVIDAFRPQKLISQAQIEEFWATKSHHGVINAIELTPARFTAYSDKNELELEELVEENNREMLRREVIVEEQIKGAFSCLAIFYMKSDAIAAKEGHYSTFATAADKARHMVAGQPIVGPSKANAGGFQVEGAMCVSDLEFLVFGSTTTSSGKKHNHFQRYVKTEGDDQSFEFLENVHCPDLANVAQVGSFCRYGKDHFIVAAVETEGTSLKRLNIHTMRVELTTEPLPIHCHLSVSPEEPGVAVATRSVFEHRAEVVKVDLATGGIIESFAPLDNVATEYDEASLDAAAFSDGRIFFVKTLPAPSQGILIDSKNNGECLKTSEEFAPGSFMALPSSSIPGAMLAVNSTTGALHLASADRHNSLSFNDSEAAIDLGFIQNAGSVKFTQFPNGKVLAFNVAPDCQAEGNAFAQVHDFGCCGDEDMKPFLNVEVPPVPTDEVKPAATEEPAAAGEEEAVEEEEKEDEVPATTEAEPAPAATEEEQEEKTETKAEEEEKPITDTRDAQEEHDKEVSAQQDDAEVEKADAAEDDDLEY